MWCWSGGRGILTELFLCHSIVYCYKGWLVSNEKNIETVDHKQNCFTVIVSSKCNTFFPAMCKSFYAVHEELFIQLFKPVIYGMDEIFITLICLSTKWIFQRLEHIEVRWSQVCRIWWVIQQFEAALSNSDHSNSGGVGWCDVVMKQHTLTQLSTSFVLDSCTKFSEWLCIIDASDCLSSPSSQPLKHPHCPKMHMP